MLIDFTAENYRSIKEPVTLSAIAQRTRKSGKVATRRFVKPDDEIAPPFVVEGRGFELLPALAIFGANASGKSNVLRALNDLLTLMKFGSIDRATRQQTDNISPFLLDDSTSNRPTRFDLRAAVDGSIYRYCLTLINKRVLHERLEHIPRSSPQSRYSLLFDRRLVEGTTSAEWSNGPDFGKAYLEIQQSLSGNESFMGFVAERLRVPVLSSFSDWISIQWASITVQEYTRHAPILLHTLSSKLSENVRALVSEFDPHVKNIDVELDMGFKVWVWHDGQQSKVKWPIEEESIGTQHLLALAVVIVLTLDKGGLLIVDELNASLHPLIARHIVKMFQNTKTNPRRAQLIFSSHDSTLLQDDLLRRDQVWFTEKREDGSTNLYALSDFRPRNDLALARAYLDGRFGAVPILPDEYEPPADLLEGSEPVAA